MTFLELCQMLRQKAGVPGTGPTDVVAQAGELALLVDLIKNAWIDIQNSKATWDFLWVSDQTLTIVPDGGPYNVANFSHFATRPVIDGRDWLTVRDYFDYKATYDVTMVTRERPNYIMIRPDRRLVVETNPAENYTITFDYYRTPQELAVSTDVPLMPARHHMVIVWLALIRYAEGEEAVNLIQTAQLEYGRTLSALQLDQLPTVHLQKAKFA